MFCGINVKLREMKSYENQTIDGRYRVEKLLGKGGMGSVYSGRNIAVGKRVAIKFLHRELADNEEIVKRFYREAQSAAALEHRNIIDVVDMGVWEDEQPYLVMEYLQGESLASLLKRVGRIDISAALGVLEPTLLALSVAHQSGMVHRDLKPENIFLVYQSNAEPLVKLIDFGISKIAEGSDKSRLTATGSIMGTPAYMAPEQAMGNSNVDHRADLYAIGVILFEMLTGELPQTGKNYNELLMGILTRDPRRIREINPDLPLELDTLVNKSLDREPANRHQSAPALLEELRELQGFAERRENLTLLGDRISTDNVAWGDLGSKSSKPSSQNRSASELLSEIVDREMAGESTSSPSGTGHNRGGRKALLVAVIAVLVAVGGTIAWKLTTQTNQPPHTVPLAAAPADKVPSTPSAKTAGNTVAIELSQLPQDAAVFYNDAPIVMNPLKLQRSEGLSVIKVTRQGYQPFVVSVVPDEDKTIAVVMQPEPADRQKSTSSPRRSASRSKKKKSKRSKKEFVEKQDEVKSKPKKKTLTKGKRDTRFADDWED